MKVSSSNILAAKKPALKLLLAELLKKYEFASILATDSFSKRFGVSAGGINIGESSMYAELGYVAKI